MLCFLFSKTNHVNKNGLLMNQTTVTASCFCFCMQAVRTEKHVLPLSSYHGQYTLQTHIHNSGDIIYFAKVPKI